MKDFDIAKYLREHQLGSYGILNHYVDLKSLKEGHYGYYISSGDEKYFIPSAIDSIVADIVGYKNRESNDAKNLQKQINDILKGPDSESLKQLKNKLSDYGENVVAYNRAGNDPHGADQVPAPRKEDFDKIVGLLKQLGLKDKNIKENKLAEEETEVELNTEIPYEGPEHKLTGNGEGDEFAQAETVSEEAPVDDTRIMDLGGNMIEQGVISLMDDGFPAEDVLELCQILVNDQYGAKASGMQFEETFPEGDTDRLADLINRQNLALIKMAVQNIFDDLTDDGFEAEDVERYLVNYVRKAAVPYLLK